MADDIRDWLAGLGLAEHSDAFVENAIDRTLLPHLTDEDLKALGITKLGERKRLLLAIAAVCDDDNALPREVLASRATATTTEQEAERRLLTVMFCDLVGSTALSRQLDPEDLREIMRRYQASVAGAVTRYGGHIAKYLGDGVLAYFGWPQAYEDQAERAVRAGLDATLAVGRLKAAGGTKLAARVGIESGQVVVGDLETEAGRDPEAISGATPNLAARLQSIASPGQVIIGETTRRLAGQLFALSDLGAHELKGFDVRVRAWAVESALKGESRFRAAHGTVRTSLVGRAAELQILLDRWHLAKNGEGQVVWISGEAGIGKSRLLEALCNGVSSTDHTCIRYQCSPYHTNSPLYPITQQLRHEARFAPTDSDRDELNKLESLLRETGDLSESVPVLADLLSISYEARYAPLDQPPQQTKQRLLNVLISQLMVRAEHCPVLVLLEDAHWIDPTSQELLERFARLLPEAPMLLIVTHRPQWPPFWGHSQGTALRLNRLGKRQSTEFVQQMVGHNCPAELVQRIVRRADGIPLFIEELTKTVLEGGLSLEGANVPTSLQASLIERLDRLGEGKEVAQIGAVIGRTFPHDLLAALSSLGEVELDRAIDRLVDAGLLDRSGLQVRETYTFRHALIRDAAYDCLLRSTRRRLHRAVAELLTKGYPDFAGNQRAVVAYHYLQAGDANRAANASLRAARYAIDRSANAEAVAHAESGLQASEKLPKTRERDELELALQIALGSAMVATKGYADPAVSATYRRARELCRSVGDTDKMLLILRGQHVHALSSGRLTEALQTAEQFAEVAYGTRQNDFHIGAQHNLSQVNFVLGNPLTALAEGEKGIALFNEDHQSIDGWAGGAPIVQCYVWSAAAAACVGDDHRSREYAASAVRLSEQTGQDFSRVHCYALLCLSAIIRRDISSTLELSGQANRICEKYNIDQWGAWARMAQTWARAQQSEAPALLAEFKDAFESYRNLGVRFCEPFFMGLLADVSLLANETVEGRAAVDQALESSCQTGERWFVAELHRLEGKLVGAGANEDFQRIADCLRKGIEAATTQGAVLFALRCAIDLTRVDRCAEFLPEGQELLCEIYSRWPAGYDAPELAEAETILAT